MQTSYIKASHRVPEVVKNSFDTLLFKYNTETKQFLINLYFSSCYNLKKKEGWVPISWELMKKEWGKDKVDWNGLVKDGLIEVKRLNSLDEPEAKTFDRLLKLSREFRVTDTYIELILNFYPKTTKEFLTCEYYNAMTGRKMNAFKRHQLTLFNGNSIPKLVKASMLAIKRCPINIAALDAYMAEQSDIIFDMLCDGIPEPIIMKKQARLNNDKNCYNTLRQSGVVMFDDTWGQYYPSYSMQMSGRISEIGGGLQSCTTKFRETALKDIPNVHNYDLKSSQVNGLIQWFEIAGLDPSWLVEYLSQDKQVFADMVGIPKEVWKTCFMALIFSAQVKKYFKIEDFKDPDTAIMETLSKYAQTISDEKEYPFVAFDFYGKFVDVVMPLRAEIMKWQNWLLSTYIPHVAFQPQGDIGIINRTGAFFKLSDYKDSKGKWKNTNELKRKVSAFYLQGGEAAFIHHLTTMSEAYGFEVLGNFHDGIVTIGEVPQEAIEQAKENSALKYAQLEEKPFL